MSWTQAVTFEPEEQLVREFPLGAKLSLDSGLVAVTNRRVLVIQHKGNILRNYHLIAETRLEEIRGIGIDGIVNKKVTVTTPDSPSGRFWFYMGKDVDVFQKIVGYQRQLRLQRLQAEQTQQRIFTVIQKTEKPPLLKCSWCKQLIPEGAVKCSNCGGPAG